MRSSPSPTPYHPFGLAECFRFPVFLAVGLFLITALTVRDRFADPDLWWHLKVGEVIWTTRSIPTVDIFSFTTHQHAWTPHEWLAQLMIYGAYHAGGYTGLMVWLYAVPSLVFVGVYLLSALYSGNSKVALLGGLTAWLFGTISLSIRPLLLGHLLLVAELLILYMGRNRHRRWLWTLPPLFAIWVNCHGSYSFGLMVLACYVVLSFVTWSAGSVAAAPWPPDRRRTLCASLVLSSLALLVNPVGWRLLLYPFDTMFQQHIGLSSVAEWMPLPMNEPRAIAMLLVVAVILGMVLIRRSVLFLDELTLLCAAGGLALLHTRMLFLFGIFAGPVLCRLCSGLWEGYDPSRDSRVGNSVLMSVAAAIVLLSFPSVQQLEEQVRSKSPVAAVNYIRAAGLSGNMANEYEFGGYLIWALPERKVFIDGRSDVYEWTGVLAQFARWMTLQEDPAILLHRYQINYCLLSARSPMANVLPHLPGWREVYSDQVARVFALTAPGSSRAPSTETDSGLPQTTR
jgi:hypothetical protein